MRDRAIIGVMVYGFARVVAVTRMSVEDYFQSGKNWRFRLHEKADSFTRSLPIILPRSISTLTRSPQAYGSKRKTLLFQSIRHGEATGKKLAQADVYRMIRRRALASGHGVDVCCHTWRATGITAYARRRL